ncbi:P2Y purinoceptor 1-like [Sinocyclocheilus anshuiensis]|uniref:P2Y purinoceptor 1-like n=1 Tax=Sinocyclocheilus anshuiensis TaxID=1608454 RepID=A0A671K8G5_9TELE|nr:PREDICTED: P2Y purinoceptor 1-like [Sinocyclocheilus anshuiensis]
MESNSTCKLVHLDFTHKFLPSVYVTVFTLGVIGNCLGLKSMYDNWRKIGNVNIFVLNLCLADILYLLTLPYLVVYYASNSKWTFGDVFCKLLRLCFCINLYGSIGFLTCISVYRYLGIVHTLRVKGRIAARHSVVIVTLVWFLVFLQSLPDMFFDKTSNNVTSCFDTTSDIYIREYLKYSIGRTVLGFGIPLIIMLCCYGHVAFTLMTKKDIDVFLKLRCLRLVVILTLLFSVCFIPYHIFRNVNLATRISKLDGTCQKWYSDVYIANQVGNGLACMNSAINPLVYLFNSDELLMKCFIKCGRARQSAVVPLAEDSPLQEQTLDSMAKK